MSCTRDSPRGDMSSSVTPDAAEVDVRRVGAGDALDLGLGEEGAHGQREHLAELHEVATLGEVSSRSTRLRKPLLSPLDSATCASVRFCAMRVLRSLAPMGVATASADGWIGRMGAPPLTAVATA